MLVRRFLSSTPTQLTYAGLFSLSSTLDPGTLAALLRNSHLSVLYRPLPPPSPSAAPSQPSVLPPPPGQIDPSYDHATHLASLSLSPPHSSTSSDPLPPLLMLATDAAFTNEEEVVWESLVDVDGGASEFFNGRMERSQARVRQREREREEMRSRQREEERRGREREGGDVGRGKMRAVSQDARQLAEHDAESVLTSPPLTPPVDRCLSLALAHQLQQEEYEHSARERDQERQRALVDAESRDRDRRRNRQGVAPVKDGSRPRGPAGLNAFVGGRESRPHAPSSQPKGRSSSNGGEKKEKCIVC